MTFSPSPTAASAPAAAFFTRRTPAYRHKQIRVLVKVSGSLRLPPHNVSRAWMHSTNLQEATWHTSSLYTFSPHSGLIAAHEVEAIRPLPGEGVADWLMSRLLGWTGRHGQMEGGGGGGSPVPVPVRSEAVGQGRGVRNKDGMELYALRTRDGQEMQGGNRA
jgi:hypothetical protein